MRDILNCFIPLPRVFLSPEIDSAERRFEWCKIASKDLQAYLIKQAWAHNFGLSNNAEGNVIGKMFGILVVSTEQNEIGYISAFSGKLAGSNQHARFVPPVFDALTENSFLNIGMTELASINNEIAMLEQNASENSEELEFLKSERRDHSIALQQKLFENYSFLNQAGNELNLIEIFQNAGYKNPPSGAGECAGPKLLQFDFQKKLKPLALAEYWWGLAPKAETWKHGEVYPSCKEKCEPILNHMLTGLDDLIFLI
ncbi:MAG: pseudouridylate synthase [Bacteroidetes bacterium]|nr:pseudouridylate synthase [Bacteroidota bacterium]